MSKPQLLKVECTSCTGHIEFSNELHGQMINCPHCGLTTILRVPGIPQQPQAIYTKEKPKTSLITQVLGAVLILFLLAYMVSLYNSASSSSEATRKTVNASIRCTDTTIVILNGDKEAWRGITVFLNGSPPFTYRAKLGSFEPNERQEFPLNEFAKKSGERFNPYTTKVVEVWIGGGGYDYRSYKL